MFTLTNLFLIGLHAFVAWTLVEAFVNNAHKLNRKTYVVLHNVVVVIVFGTVFGAFYAFVGSESLFWTTVIAMAFILFLEVFVFRFLYSGERWFLNWVDWIVPMFFATTVIYQIGHLLG